MFFYLSKILSYAINPLYWILLFLGYSLLTKNIKFKFKSFKMGIILLLVFTNQVIFLEFARLWEPEGKRIEEVGHYSVGIVLGGMAEYNNDLKRLSLRRGGDRIWQAIHLYHKGKIDKILISGDSGYMIDKGLDEAEQLKAVLVEECIPEDDIIVENKSKNTYQNALESKLILDSMPGEESVLLITSALHMRRSAACFKKVGFTNFETFTTDHYTGKKKDITTLINM
jgi:uncharacterized SAM-binding protein YcdF (DUF218 family)